jgi:predicted nucleic acid-binding protein
MLKTTHIDSGPLIALFDKDYAYHRRVVNFIKSRNYRFMTTLAVLTEVSYMLNFNVNAQLDFFNWVMARGVTIHPIGQGDMYRVVMLIEKYHDVPMDFADCSLVMTSEMTGIREIISLDSDFDIYRLPGKIRIVNLFSR